MNLLNLIVTLVLNTQAYKQGLNSASKDASSFSSKAGTAFKNVGKAISAAIGIATGFAAAMKKVLEGTINFGDEIDKQSQKMGLSAEAYQKWSLAAQMAGSDASTLQTGIRQLTKFIQDLSDGTGDSMLALQQLGISYDDFMNMSFDEQLKTIVEAMQGIDDSTQKADLAQQLFGSRAYQELMPLLNQEKGSLDELFQSYEDMGLIMDDISVKKSAELNDKFTLLTATVKGLTNQFVVGLYPQLNNTVDAIQNLLTGTGDADENMRILEDSVADMVDKLVNKLPDLLNIGADIIFIILDSLIASLGNSNTISKLFNFIEKLLLKAIDLLPTILKTLTTLIPAIIKGLLELDWGQIIFELIQVILVDLPNAVLELAFNLIDLLFDMLTQPSKAKEQYKKIGVGIGQGIVNGLIGMVETGINKMIDGISSIWTWLGIKGLDHISIPRVDWVSQLAEGGMMSRKGTLYIAGEAGAEIVASGSHGTGVANVEQIQEAMYNALADIAPVLVNGIVGGMNMQDSDNARPIIVKLGEKEFKSYIVRASNDNLNQKGRQSLNKVTRY